MLKIALALFLLLPTAAFADPLAPFAGYFSGTATGTMASGAKESFTCRATNGLKDGTLTIALRCANSGAKFEARSRLRASGQNVSGTWLIVDPSYDGSVSGSVRGETITATITASAFSGSITVSRSGNGLVATITIRDGLKLVANLGR